MKSQVSKIEEDTLVAPDPDNDTPFNGVDTCFVLFPKRVATVPASPAPTWATPCIPPTAQDASDSDDEDTITSRIPSISVPAWTPCEYG
jgi:hypothetical protein